MNTDSIFEVAPFHTHFDVLGVLAAMALFYEYGVRRLAETQAPRGEVVVTLRQRIAFYASLLSLYLVSSWPVHDVGETLSLIHI